MFSANSPWFHYQIRDFTMKSLCICYANLLWIYSFSREFILNSLLLCEFTIASFSHSRINPLSFSRNPYKFSIFFMNSLRFHYRIRKVTFNSLSIRRIHNESIICFANSQWIHYQLREFTINSLSVRRIQYRFILFFREFITYFANSQ